MAESSGHPRQNRYFNDSSCSRSTDFGRSRVPRHPLPHQNRYSGGSLSTHGSGFEHRRAPRHPAHLRGRAIGMYYAKLNKEKRKREDFYEDENTQSTKILCGGSHKQKGSMLPEISFSPDIAKTLKELANLGIPVSSQIFDKHGEHSAKVVHSVVSNGKGILPCCEDENHFRLLQQKELDGKLYDKLCCRSSNSYLQIFRRKLPAYKMQEGILSALNENQVMVIMGETGCGKTTQVPQFILDSFISSKKGSLCKIVCTQPRRISAITVAERVAQERGVPCGKCSEVGYQIRLENKLPSDQGSVLFCTTGIVLQWLQENPLLSGVTHVIVDEVHERDLLCDFLLIILKDILKVRSDLKVILMSATLDRENISWYFGGCPTIHIPGLTFPVKVFMLEDIIETLGYIPEDHGNKKRRHVKMSIEEKLDKAQEEVDKLDYLHAIRKRYLPQTIEILESWNEEQIDLDFVVCLIKHIVVNEKDGAVLVFVPGWEQISKLKTLIMSDKYLCTRCLIIPLHSLMPTINQREAFEKPPSGKRKVVLATNIAETSITIDDVVFVIDTGKIKLQNYDHSCDIATLKPEWAAKSNAKQRKGRAGRTQDGFCFRLFTKFREERLEEYQLPEMLRVRLEEIILKVKLLKLGYAQEFLQKALDPPSEVMVAKSVDLLKKLGALDDDESLTALGHHLAQLPVAPQLGKMCILGAIFSCLDPVLSIAASLSFREPFMIPLGQEKEVDAIKQKMAGDTNSDHVLLYRIIKKYDCAVAAGNELRYCSNHYLSNNTLKMLVGLKGQIAEHLCRLKFVGSYDFKDPDYNSNSDNLSVLKAIICAGLFPNIAALSVKKKPNRYVSCKGIDSSGSTVQFHPKSVNCFVENVPSMLFVYFLKVKSSKSFIHDSTFVNCFPAVLFGNNVKICEYFGSDILCVGNWLHIKCPPNELKLIRDVSEKVKEFLLWKFAHMNKNTKVFSHEKYFIERIVKLVELENF